MSDVDLAVERRLFPHATESSYNCVELIWQASKENPSDRRGKKEEVLFRLRRWSTERGMTFFDISQQLLDVVKRRLTFPLRADRIVSSRFLLSCCVLSLNVQQL